MHLANSVLQLLVLSFHIPFCYTDRAVQLNCWPDCLGLAHLTKTARDACKNYHFWCLLMELLYFNEMHLTTTIIGCARGCNLCMVAMLFNPFRYIRKRYSREKIQ